VPPLVSPWYDPAGAEKSSFPGRHKIRLLLSMMADNLSPSKPGRHEKERVDVGTNAHGELGDDSTTSRLSPVQAGGLGGVAAIAERCSVSLRGSMEALTVPGQDLLAVH
jgi:hypothetical protein